MIKKITCLVIALVILTACYACTPNNATQNNNAQVYDRYNNITDFANDQGYKNWEYLCGDVEGELSYMVYSKYSGKYLDFTGQGFIQKDHWIPSISGEIMVAFKAPKNGKINVTLSVGVLALQEVGSDGIAFYVTSDNSSSYFYNATLRGETLSANTSFECELKQGERIYFIMSALTSNTNDRSCVDITITY